MERTSSDLAFAVKEFTENVRLHRIAVDVLDQAVYEKELKDRQARELKKAELAAGSSK